mgnify:FL=1
MENNTNAVALYGDNGEHYIADLTTATSSYCSMVADTPEEKATLFNAMNNPDERIADHINETIAVKDLYCEVVQCVNQETGEVSTCPRIVLIDDKGKSYASVSLGIYSAMKKLMSIYGQPTWDKPIKVKVMQISKGTRKMLSLKLV